MKKMKMKTSITLFSKKMYAVSIANNHAFIAVVKKRGDNYILIESDILEIEDAAKYLKNKKNLYINIDQEVDVIENIKVPTVIKSDKNIKNFIFFKIKEANPDKELLFNYNKLITQNEEEEEVIYEVKAIDENRYIEKFKAIKNFKNIKSITISEYSLFNISKECLKVKEFISIYVQANKIIAIAVKDEKIIFSRTIEVASVSPETLQMEIAENILQTLSYIGTQIRDIRFKNLVLSGSIAMDENISRQIALYNNLNISILSLNLFVKNLSPLEAQEHILTIGALLTPKKYRFMPKSILATQQYEMVSTILLLLTIFGLGYISYITFNQYLKYRSLLQENQVLKTRYISILKNTKMYPMDELSKYVNHIKRVKLYLAKSPLDILIELKPLIDFSKPIIFSYKDDSSFEIFFEKKFSELKELYDFDKKFSNIFEKINKMDKFSKKVKINYEKLTYSVKISSKNKKNQSRRVGRRM